MPSSISTILAVAAGGDAAKAVMSLSNQAFRVFAITKIGQHIDNVAARLLDFSRNRLAGRNLPKNEGIP